MVDKGIENVEACFNFIDDDGGGSISYVELMSAVQRLGLSGTPADCKRMMLEADKNGNGVVDLNEFHAWQLRVGAEAEE
jgi:calcium-binding protein CML